MAQNQNRNNQNRNNQNRNNQNRNNQNQNDQKKFKTKRKSNYKDKGTRVDKLIDQIQSQIDKKEMEIARLKEANAKSMQNEKYTPNMFLFGANESEYEVLLDEKEKKDLIQNKEQLRQNLENLNPYDSRDVDEMEKAQEEIEKAKEQGEKEHSHPLDFTEPEPHTSSDKYMNDSSNEDPREEYAENRGQEKSPWQQNRRNPWER